jgi:hypothetical protein
MALQPIEGQPGLFRDTDSGQIVNIRDFRESDKFDSVIIPSGNLLVAGSEFIYFQDIQGKRDLDTNFKTPRKLSAGESMVLDRIGLSVRLALGNVIALPSDIKKVVENGYFRLKINDIMQDEGPMIKFPSGYGLSGQTTETDAGIVTIGVPATASASRLVKKQMLNQNHELDGAIRFDARTWTSGTTGLGGAGPTVVQPTLERPLMITCFLHGLVRAAVTK